MRVCTALLVGALVMLSPSVLQTASAGAAPGDEQSPAAGTTSVSLDSIGGSSTLSFTGQAASVSVAVPVPQGLTPTVITGTVAVPANVASGEIDAIQGDRLLSRTPIPVAPNAPITIPLTGLRVDGNGASVTLRTYLSADQFCTFDPDDPMRITGAAITFSGTEQQPATIADFMPPILRTLTIYVPARPEYAEQNAAVHLASAVVLHYGTALVRVQTRSLPAGSVTPPDAPGFLERQIVVRANTTDSMSLERRPGGAPFLLMSGTADNLQSQAQMLTSGLAPIAVSSTAMVSQLAPGPQMTPDVRTLSDIGAGTQTVTAPSRPSVIIGIDQTKLGRPSKNVRVELTGSYTPLPRDSGGRLSVRIGGNVIDSWQAESDGTFDKWVTIPDDELRRYTELIVTLERGDEEAGCGNRQLVTLTVSDSGEIRSSVANPPVPAGFQSLPQAVMPGFTLAFHDGDFADTARGVSIVAGLQRQSSSVPLGITLATNWKSALTSSGTPLVLIDAGGQDFGDMPLPVKAGQSGAYRIAGTRDTDGKAFSIQLSPATPFGSMQVFRQSGRSVVTAGSSGDAALLDSMLAWLDADPTRWSGLDGDVMMQTTGRAPLLLDIPSAGKGKASSKSHSLSGSTIRAIVVGVAAIVVVIAVLLWYFVIRRRKSGDA
ncbi:membrane protein [Gordonia jinhuaensis]|uniref:Membrane protein n=1 Tax=Gordonia jinhuaensis TaxID=1517702 RepID=A0A916THZ0_9ACTN|nr:hypothetical protein [Gordonia jinhuaensis]GGB46392.1 membrane protein [Gordonia jinhuaensis]